MKDFKEINAEELNENPFKLIGKDWMLITAEKNERVNMMTASWGGLGVIWNKNVATIYVRKSRFTKEFIDDADTFSLCVLGEKYKKELSYCGSISGRNEDKVLATGLTVAHENGTNDTSNTNGAVPYFCESKLVLICKKLYSQDMNAESFTAMGKDFPQKFYSDNDWHTMYIAEIEKILIKQD